MMVNFFHGSAMHLGLEMINASEAGDDVGHSLILIARHRSINPRTPPPPCKVVITDIEKVLGLTRTNVELNGLSLEQR